MTLIHLPSIASNRWTRSFNEFDNDGFGGMDSKLTRNVRTLEFELVSLNRLLRIDDALRHTVWMDSKVMGNRAYVRIDGAATCCERLS